MSGGYVYVIIRWNDYVFVIFTIINDPLSLCHAIRTTLTPLFILNLDTAQDGVWSDDNFPPHGGRLDFLMRGRRKALLKCQVDIYNIYSFACYLLEVKYHMND